MKRAIYLLVLLAVAVAGARAQSEATFTHYTVSPWLINPGLVGFDQTHQLRLNYRAAFSGFPGAPNTYALNYSGPVGKTLGIGGQLLAESSAQTFRYHAKVSYAFNHHSGPFQLGGGFATGFVNARLRPGQVSSSDGGDPVLQAALDGASYLEASMGVHMRYRDQTFVGLSFPSMISARLDEAEVGERERRGGLDNYLVHFGHDLVFRELSFRLTPSVLLAQVYGAPFRADLNVRASFLDEQFVAGLSYRAGAGGALAMLLGTRVDHVKVYYSYDISFGSFQGYNNGAHELTIGFDFDSRIRPVDGARYH